MLKWQTLNNSLLRCFQRLKVEFYRQKRKGRRSKYAINHLFTIAEANLSNELVFELIQTLRSVDKKKNRRDSDGNYQIDQILLQNSWTTNEFEKPFSTLCPSSTPNCFNWFQRISNENVLIDRVTLKFRRLRVEIPFHRVKCRRETSCLQKFPVHVHFVYVPFIKLIFCVLVKPYNVFTLSY